jgi:hypothetical protein
MVPLHKALTLPPQRVAGWVGSRLVPRVAARCHHWTATTTNAVVALA